MIPYLINVLRETTNFIFFVLKGFYSKDFFNRIRLKRDYNGCITLLANGPSLKDILPYLTTDAAFKDTGFIVLNFFALDTVFTEIKPEHYCLADPLFFGPSVEEKRVLELYKTLDLYVCWKMNLYIPNGCYKKFMVYSNIKNKHIKVVRLNTIEYTGYKKLQFLFYKKNLAMPPLRTIAVMAIFIGINSGYATIKLYGVDHTFFDSLFVDEKNNLCIKYTHFYEKSQKIVYTPWIEPSTGKPVKMSEYLDMTGSIFKAHEILEKYAQYRGVKILNCTKNSLIDSYERFI